MKRSGLMDSIELLEEYPSLIASKLINNEIDLGLVPVAIIPLLPEAHILTDFCIGSVGAVHSVALFSEVPITDVEKVILDYQSRTSVNLAKMLFSDYWKINPVLESATEGFRNSISGTTAAIVIGDRALDQRDKSAYVYDLGEAWMQLTGLPFVFAAWVANKPLPVDFEEAFNLANAYGIKHLDEVIAAAAETPYDLKKYYTESISYHLDESKRKGMELFLQKLTQTGNIV